MQADLYTACGTGAPVYHERTRDPLLQRRGGGTGDPLGSDIGRITTRRQWNMAGQGAASGLAMGRLWYGRSSTAKRCTRRVAERRVGSKCYSVPWVEPPFFVGGVRKRRLRAGCLS